GGSTPGCASVAAVGRPRALLLAGVRLVQRAGRVLDRLEPAAAEAQSRPLRAGAGEKRATAPERAVARDALAGPAELGPAGSAGGQGGGVRYGRHARAAARGAAAGDRRADAEPRGGRGLAHERPARGRAGGCAGRRGRAVPRGAPGRGRAVGGGRAGEVRAGG